MQGVPRDETENKRYRLTLLEKADNDTELQLILKRKCALDFTFFCNVFCWTYDPRETNPHKPFILWPKQEIFVEWLEQRYIRSQQGEKINVLIDKPRGVGVSYVLMVWLLWHYLFHDFTARVGSRKEDYVDKKGDPDSLFAKIDYQLARLPDWLLGNHERAYLILKTQGGGTNSIVGESANPDFGRGGRKNAAVFDEFGFWEWARASWESAGEATNLRIAPTTPPESGHDSHFYKLLTGQAGRVEIFSFDWQDDPRRNEKWRQEAQATKSEEEYAREVLKSYEGTTKGKVYAVSLRHAILQDVEYDARLPLFISWDFGLDAVAMIWWQKDFQTDAVSMIDCYTNSNKDIGFYLPFVNGVIPSGQYSYTDYELAMIEQHHAWSRTITHFGDPDVRKRNLITKESTKDWLRDHGVYVQSIPWGGREWKDMKEKTLMLFRRLTINEKRCEPVLSALRNAKYPERREGSQTQNEPLKPVHDWSSHFRTSVEYWADNEPETNKVITRVQSSSATPSKIKLPHEVEEERNRRENEELAQVKRRLRTVLSATQRGATNPNRVL